jgi:hypothetical protein
VRSHENWCNAFVSQQRARGTISFRKNPGCWLLVWGWFLLMGIVFILGLFNELAHGRTSTGQAFGVVCLILLILTTLLVPLRIGGLTFNHFLAQSVAIPLIRSDSEGICLECNGLLSQGPNGLWNCQDCRTPHFLPIPFEQAEPSDLLERLSQSKQLGHLAASRACKAHYVSANATATTHKRISRGLFIATPILAFGLVGTGTASTAEGIGITLFGAGLLGGISALMGRKTKNRATHDATFSKTTVSGVKRLT